MPSSQPPASPSPHPAPTASATPAPPPPNTSSKTSTSASTPVLDGGPTEVGLESTVLDPAARIIYRPGAIIPAMLEPILGSVSFFQPSPDLQRIGTQQTTPTLRSLPSPGVAIRHYAPYARLVLVADEDELNTRLQELQSSHQSIGVMLPQDWILAAPAEIFPWSSLSDPTGLAQTLFAGLRELDHRGVTLILCPLPNADGLGLAIRDRLEKAAKPK